MTVEVGVQFIALAAGLATVFAGYWQLRGQIRTNAREEAQRDEKIKTLETRVQKLDERDQVLFAKLDQMKDGLHSIDASVQYIKGFLEHQPTTSPSQGGAK